MQILDYKHIVATERRDGYFAIPELERQKSSVKQFIELANLDIELIKPTGFIYVDGFTITQAESGLGSTAGKYVVAVTGGSSYALHKWISSFKTPEYVVAATITSGTCASGIQALMIAEEWLMLGVCEEVIVIGGERITEDTLRLFKELRIDIMCGDGFVYMKFGKGMGNLESINWKYAYNANPFTFTSHSLNTLIPDYPLDFIKLHGTGTPSNTEAEADLAELGIPLTFKSRIGHTQGISSLLEMCIVLSSDAIKGTILVLANGLGGFYGSCTLYK